MIKGSWQRDTCEMSFEIGLLLNYAGTLQDLQTCAKPCTVAHTKEGVGEEGAVPPPQPNTTKPVCRCLLSFLASSKTRLWTRDTGPKPTR